MLGLVIIQIKFTGLFEVDDCFKINAGNYWNIWVNI